MCYIELCETMQKSFIIYSPPMRNFLPVCSKIVIVLWSRAEEKQNLYQTCSQTQKKNCMFLYDKDFYW